MAQAGRRLTGAMSETQPGAAQTPHRTRFVEADGVRFAYRRFRRPGWHARIVLLQHFMGTLDNYDPGDHRCARRWGREG